MFILMSINSNQVLALVGVATLIALIWQVLLLRKATHAQTMAVVIKQLQDEQVRKARQYVFQNLKGKTDFNKWTASEVEAAELVCHNYDTVAIMVYQGMAPKKLIVSNWGNSIAKIFPIVEPMIRHYEQDRREQGLIWHNFERLFRDSVTFMNNYLGRSTNMTTDPFADQKVWDDERKFIEQMMNQRLHFFIIFFALICGGIASTADQVRITELFSVGALIALMLWMAIYRAYWKQHWLFVELKERWPQHPATLADVAARESGIRSLWSVTFVLAVLIPFACVGLLVLGAVLGILDLLK